MSDIITKTKITSSGIMVVESTQDVSEILAQNQREINEGVHDSNKAFGGGRKVASIPTNLLVQWSKEWGVPYKDMLTDDGIKAKIMARLNDMNYRKLRTHNSRI